MATIGTGKHTYELVENWAKLPDGWVLGQTAIVTDAQDRVCGPGSIHAGSYQMRYSRHPGNGRVGQESRRRS